MDIPKDEKSGEVEKPPELHVYKRRWYILSVFCLFAATQGCVWNTFSPISTTSENVFGWKDADIALLSNWDAIAYVTSRLFFSWVLHVKGLRWACVFSASLVLVGSSLRCITMRTPAFTWLAHLGQVINGWAGPVAQAAPPHLSAVWFPIHERATATALGTASSFLGAALAFVMGPYIVESSSQHPVNSNDHLPNRERRLLTLAEHDLDTDPGMSDVTYNVTGSINNVTTAFKSDMDRERQNIALYVHILAGWCLALFVTMVIYFPKKPPLPPCASAAVQREDFLLGLKHLLTRQQFWVVAVIYGVSVGVELGWNGIINVNLTPHNVSEKEASWIGFYATVSGCVFCLIVARFTDLFSRVLKQAIIALYFSSSLFFLVLALVLSDIIVSAKAVLYVTVIMGVTLLLSSVPLIMELACELAFPTSEGTTVIVLNTTQNICVAVFLFVVMIPGIGSVWMNWTLVVAVAACLPVWLLLKENYNRLAVDETNPTTDSVNTEITVVNDHRDYGSVAK